MEIGSLGLSRKPDESIIVGDPNSEFFAIFTIRKTAGEKVWVNISAPKSVPIIRGELLGKGEGE